MRPRKSDSPPSGWPVQSLVDVTSHTAPQLPTAADGNMVNGKYVHGPNNKTPTNEEHQDREKPILKNIFG